MATKLNIICKGYYYSHDHHLRDDHGSTSTQCAYRQNSEFRADSTLDDDYGQSTTEILSSFIKICQCHFTFLGQAAARRSRRAAGSENLLRKPTASCKCNCFSFDNRVLISKSSYLLLEMHLVNQSYKNIITAKAKGRTKK